jgi:predicted methyltransferase
LADSGCSGIRYLDTEPDMGKRLHRIDPLIVQREVEAAGFALLEESHVLANPNDPHNKSVFDPSIRELIR